MFTHLSSYRALIWFILVIHYCHLVVVYLHWRDLRGKEMFFKILFIFRERGRSEKKREINISVWLPLALVTWPTTQACALPGNRTSDPWVFRPALSLSHTNRGVRKCFKENESITTTTTTYPYHSKNIYIHSHIYIYSYIHIYTHTHVYIFVICGIKC